MELNNLALYAAISFIKRFLSKVTVDRIVLLSLIVAVSYLVCQVLLLSPERMENATAQLTSTIDDLDEVAEKSSQLLESAAKEAKTTAEKLAGVIQQLEDARAQGKCAVQISKDDIDRLEGFLAERTKNVVDAIRHRECGDSNPDRQPYN